MDATSSSSKENTQNPFDIPRANISRILKKVMPEGTSIANDAKTAFSKAAVIFIMYLTATAQEFATQNKKSTLTADDVLAALDDLEFAGFKDEVLKTLEQYRASQRTKKDSKKDKVPPTASSSSSVPPATPNASNPNSKT